MPNRTGSYDYAFERDGFPWAEAYYHDGKGNVYTIFQDSAARGEPHDLFAIEPRINPLQEFVRDVINSRFGPPILNMSQSLGCYPGQPC